MRKLTWACVGCCFHTRSFQQARGQARGGESSREGFLQRDFPIVSQRATASAVCTETEAGERFHSWGGGETRPNSLGVAYKVRAKCLHL